MKKRLISLAALTIIVALSFSMLPGCCCPCFTTYRDLKKLVPVGSVSGTVYAGKPKQPVPGAIVVIADKSTTTDSQGKFKMTNVVATSQTVTVTSGDLKWTGTVTVVKDGEVNLPEILLEATLLPPGATDAYPATAEDVIRAYYKAIDDRDYEKAATFRGGQMPTDITSVEKSYADYIKSVSVAAITRQEKMDYNGRSIYSVTFTTEYIQHYPAGNGDLPTVHAMQQIDGKWKIVEIGTG